MKLFVFVCITALLVSGCLQKRESIKHLKPYDSLVGATFQSLTHLRLHGVTHDPNYKQVISAYSLSPPPGSSGPEIVSVKKLPVGTIVRVYDIQRCTNCFIWSPISMLVEIPSYQKVFDVPIRLHVALNEITGSQAVILDSKFFTQVD